MVKTAMLLNGGLGTRLYPLGKFIPKCLIPVYDAPLVIHQINMLEAIGVEQIYLVINRNFEQIIKRSLEMGYAGKIKIDYIIQDTSTGCGEATLLGEKYLDEKFYLVLGDEYYETDRFFRDTVHNTKYDHYLGLTHYDSVLQITSGCHVVVADDRVDKLFEKPKMHQITSGTCWNGAAVTTPLIFEELARLKCNGQVDPLRGVVLVEAFINLMEKGHAIGAIFDPGININVTCIEDYLRASEIEKMKKVKLAVLEGA